MRAVGRKQGSIGHAGSTCCGNDNIRIHHVYNLQAAGYHWLHVYDQARLSCWVALGLTRTSFSLSPRHLLMMLLALMLKKVVEHSVATALASSVLPVPGGPYSRMPFQGASRPGARRSMVCPAGGGQPAIHVLGLGHQPRGMHPSHTVDLADDNMACCTSTRRWPLQLAESRRTMCQPAPHQ